MRLRSITVLVLAAILIAVVPLLGLAAAGRSVSAFLDFPPRTVFVAHAPFQWGAFAAAMLPPVAVAMLVAAASAGKGRIPAPARREAFPWWGWAGLLLAGAGWTLAWSEGLVPPELRRHTFTPLWLGYALVMNGLCRQRGGAAPLICRPLWFLALFPASAAFWWLFEHLNRFTANWYYTGVVARSDLDYFLQATLPFSTVLPAMAATLAWLRTWPRLEVLQLPRVRGSTGLAWLALAAGTAALAGIGPWPEPLFAAVWLAPLLILVALQQLLQGESVLSPVAEGDWRPALQPALAALLCGFFWELWNSGSAAQWHYSVPYVQGLLVFEMPLAGYGGYLPFGVICALVLDLCARVVEGRGLYGGRPVPASRR